MLPDQTFSSNRYEPRLFARLTSASSLYQAWRKVRANRGAAGIDAMSLHAFEAQLSLNLQELARSLKSKSYQPLPARFVTIAKANGKERELGILTVRDRVAQRATLDAIEPLFEPQFLDCNFAFRPNRSVEMAVQRMIAARANGYWWTVESDVADFFGSIDQKLLLDELARTVRDQEVLQLITLWLDAGTLDPELYSPQRSIFSHGKETLAELRLLLRETSDQSIDEFVAERVALPQSEIGALLLPQLAAAQDFDNADFEYPGESPNKEVGRSALKRIVKDGALLALSHRKSIGKFLGLRLLGAGGLAVGAVLLAPKAVEIYRNYFHRRMGTLQGAPISPLLTNFYMTPFDAELTQQGWRLVRYCDDFVIQCRNEEESHKALAAAQESLVRRRLQLHPEKTRIVAPADEFEFLGYVFASDGSVIPPPSVPEQVAEQIKSMARRAMRWRKRRC